MSVVIVVGRLDASDTAGDTRANLSLSHHRLMIGRNIEFGMDNFPSLKCYKPVVQQKQHTSIRN